MALAGCADKEVFILLNFSDAYIMTSFDPKTFSAIFPSSPLSYKNTARDVLGSLTTSIRGGVGRSFSIISYSVGHANDLYVARGLDD